MSGNIYYSFEDYVDLPTDITFIIHEENDTKKIEAHKYHLSKFSQIFRVQIFNSWNCEHDNNNLVEIKDSNFSAFKTFLEFAYTKDVNLVGKCPKEISMISHLASYYNCYIVHDAIKKAGFPTKLFTFYHPTTFLDHIPTDVVFNVESGEDGNSGTIMAHKYLLAQKSSVFKAMLFGPMMKSEVDIRGTTMEMFQILIDHVYERAPGLADLDTSQLFEIYNLGEMYDISSLKQQAMDQLMATTLTKSNVVCVAHQAEKQKNIFEQLSESLYKKCLQFLAKNVLKSKSDFINYSCQYTSGEYAATAFKLISDLPECTNCFTKPCQTGKFIMYDHLEKDIKISSYNDSIKGTITNIISKDHIEVSSVDGRKYKFIYEVPPRDSDVVQNPMYYHQQSVFGGQNSIFGGIGPVRGGIYYHCQSPTCRDSFR